MGLYVLVSVSRSSPFNYLFFLKRSDAIAASPIRLSGGGNTSGCTSTPTQDSDAIVLPILEVTFKPCCPAAFG
jgi:hypothetical protein